MLPPCTRRASVANGCTMTDLLRAARRLLAAVPDWVLTINSRGHSARECPGCGDDVADDGSHSRKYCELDSARRFLATCLSSEGHDEMWHRENPR